MGEWHDFFLAAAGAAAVLAGLVFVGVSINLEMIMSDPAYGLAGRALEALVLLVAVLVVTLLLLVPSQGRVLAGAEGLEQHRGTRLPAPGRRASPRSLLAGSRCSRLVSEARLMIDLLFLCVAYEKVVDPEREDEQNGGDQEAVYGTDDGGNRFIAQVGSLFGAQ